MQHTGLVTCPNCGESVYVGPDRAVASAVARVEPHRLAQAVERLHPWALSGATRTAQKQRPGLLDDLRRRGAVAAGVRA